MTSSENAGDDQSEVYRQRYTDLLAQAVATLTAAARLPRPALGRDEAASAVAGHPVFVPTEKDEQNDWAEFVTLALAGAAANVGGVEQILAGRPGSWEADGVRQLLTSTVGHDEAQLLAHRTDPVDIDVYVDEVLADLGIWNAYDQAQDELTRRYEAIGMPTATAGAGDSTPEAGAGVPVEPATAEQERQADAIAELEDRLEQQRRQDWADYGQALTASIEAAAARVDGLTVPIVVSLDLENFRDPAARTEAFEPGLADRLLAEAVEVTPLPGAGRSPLDRLENPAH